MKAISSKPKGELESKPLLEHINDLRRVLFFCLGLILVLFVTVFTLWSKVLVNFVSQPITELGIEIVFTNVSDAFTSQMKLSLIAAAVAASPAVFFALWLYVRPALYPKERRAFGGMVVAGLCLFAGGVYFAYQMVFRLAVNFFIISGEGIAKPLLSLKDYVDFLFAFLLPFGIMFQLPIAIVILTRLGLVTTKLLNKLRRYVILVIFILAAVLTPPDVVSQVLLGLPLMVLYEVGVLLSILVKPREKKTS